MPDFSGLKNHPLWIKTCQLFKGIYEISKECSGQKELESTIRLISRHVAEGVLAQDEDTREFHYSQALERTRDLDHTLYNLAQETYTLNGASDDKSLYQQMIRAFIHADQLKELIFNQLKDTEGSRFSA